MTENQNTLSNENSNSKSIIDQPQLHITKQDSIIDQAIWESISDEITKVTTLIREKGDTLEPSEIKTVTNLRREIEGYLKKYNTDLSNAYKAYKLQVNTILDNMGYQEINEYITRRNAQAKKEQNDRLTAKLQKFQEIIKDCLSNYPTVSKTFLAAKLQPAIQSRFPNINSADKKKDIKDWTPIITIINTHLNVLEKTLNENPILLLLPEYSQSMRGLTTYLETSNMTNITNIKVLLENDRPIIEDILLRKQIQTPEQAYQHIQQIMGTDMPINDKMNMLYDIIMIYKSLPKL